MFHNIKIKLVGCSFQKPKHKPERGQAIKLKLEPNNPHDHHAIAVYNSYDEKIGYVGTENTVSNGNKINGCVTNLDIKPLIDFDDDNSYLGIISKFKDYFGFIDITIDIDE